MSASTPALHRKIIFALLAAASLVAASWNFAASDAAPPIPAQNASPAAGRTEAPSRTAVLATMKRATEFMTGKVAVRGGYVWYYLPDLSRRWGELEATPEMIWVQAPGTVQMGHVFLDAFHATGDEDYYRAATQTADALIAGQLPCGGWNYLIDFAGEAHLREWYSTVGRNAWRLEEYHHYYGNATFDDSSTAGALRFLLRVFLEKRDARFKAALDRALQFTLDAQLPSGGWPQRFPRTDKFEHTGRPDYTGYITFNDGVTGGNVELLVQCYQALGDQRLLAPIRRGMEVFLATLHPSPQAGWSLQHTHDLQPAGARTYEPKALATHTTAVNIDYLLRFYRLTGDKKFLARVPEIFTWLESVRLPPEVRPRNEGTHPTFVELGTNRPFYLHRAGSNVVNGRYFLDDNWRDTVGHYSSFRAIDLAGLRQRYAETCAVPPGEAQAHSPLFQAARGDAFPRFFERTELMADGIGAPGPSNERVNRVLTSLTPAGYWSRDLPLTSHRYGREGSEKISTGDFRATQVGDESDTSPFRNPQSTPGISTGTYIRNMSLLIDYLAAGR
ncbi:MAG TPA: pectate lyase [Opitutaceae bacterium]|nr:pectate lyase [Opitutaceae bacterium]